MKTVNFKNVFIIAILATSLNSCARYNTNNINGNGNITTTNRITSTYDGIKCYGSMDFILVKGKEGHITLQGESNLLNLIETEVKNNILVIKLQDGANFTTTKDIVITIPFEDITEVSLTGSGDLYTQNTISEQDLEVGVTGSGDVILDIKTTNVKGSVTGSGDLTLKGETENLDFSVTGSGDFHGYGLTTNSTDVSVTGSGDAQVMTTKFLKARVTGSGDIAYKGHPEKEDTKVSGSGSIEML